MTRFAIIAQLAEHDFRKIGVGGAIPLGGFDELHYVSYTNLQGELKWHLTGVKHIIVL